MASERRSRILRHQPSHSGGSASMLSLLSRTRSNGNLSAAEHLTSPSLISLHSISSPLTHTLVKTELTYPKGGPTPEQLKLISSRESFARFGRPYGADAIAFAASTSRADLEPPPGFEEVAAEGGGAGASSSAQAGRASPDSGSQDPDSSEDVRLEHDLSDVEEAQSPTESQAAPLSPSSPPAPSAAEPAHATPPPSDALPPAESAQAQATSDASPAPPPAPPSPGPTQKPAAPKAPPSAFKGVPAASPTGDAFAVRSASRASSFMSYATAEESLHSPSPSPALAHTPAPYESQLSLGGYESAAETPVSGSAPPTPRAEPRRIDDAADTTVTS